MCYEKSLNPPFVSSNPYVVYPRIKRSLQYIRAIVFISGMVWTCFYPGNRLHAASLKVGLVMDDFGMHDRSYNQLAYQGLVQAEKELGIKGSAVSVAKEEDYPKIIGRYVQGGYELVIGNGVLMKQAFIEASQRFPGTKISFDRCWIGRSPESWFSRVFLTAGFLFGRFTGRDACPGSKHTLSNSA